MRAPETTTPEFFMEIFLAPGEIFWGDEETRIKTILGSCVAICLWHPEKKIGGMSHSLLAEKGQPGGELDARYVSDALLLFEKHIQKSGTRRSDYVVKLFGGSTTMATQPMIREKYFAGKPTGLANAEYARAILEQHGFSLAGEHTGDTGYRNLILDLWSGNAWLRHIKPEKTA